MIEAAWLTFRLAGEAKRPWRPVINHRYTLTNYIFHTYFKKFFMRKKINVPFWLVLPGSDVKNVKSFDSKKLIVKIK